MHKNNAPNAQAECTSRLHKPKEDDAPKDAPNAQATRCAECTNRMHKPKENDAPNDAPNAQCTSQKMRRMHKPKEPYFEGKRLVKRDTL